VRRRPQGRRRSVGRGMHRPAIEPRKTYHPGCRHSSECGRPYARAHYLRAPGRSGVVTDPGMCRRFLYGNREIPRPAGCAHNVRCSGPHREGEEPKPMMHDRGKSDSAIVAVKPTNNAGQPAAEPRAGTKRNAGEQSTHRAQGRARVTHKRRTGRRPLQRDVSPGLSRSPVGSIGGCRYQCPAALSAAALLRTIRPSTATPVLVLIRNGLTSIEAMRVPASAIRLERPTIAFTADASCSAGLPR
jgi:hypothetical protein